MRRLFLLLVVLILSVWLGLLIAKDPGYAVFAYQNWSVEMPLWFAMVSLLILLFLFYLIFRFLEGIDFSLYRWRNWLNWRRKHKAHSKTNRGLIELIEGHWRNAEHYLMEGVDQSEAPLINYLAAAKSAHHQGAFDRRDGYLRKAHQVIPNAEIAIGLTQAQLQFEQGQLEQATATLERLRTIAPKHGFVLKLLEKVYIRLADWQGLIRLLPSLKKAKMINDDQFQLFEENTYQELLRCVANKNATLDSIKQAWMAIPKNFQKKPILIATYVKALMSFPETGDESAELIQKALKGGFDKELVYLYGLLKTTSPKNQLEQAEKWLRKYGNQASLLLTLGRLSERCNIWGKARNYLEESIKLEANPEAYMENGRLLTQLGEGNLAAQQYRVGLELAEKQIMAPVLGVNK